MCVCYFLSLCVCVLLFPMRRKIIGVSNSKVVPITHEVQCLVWAPVCGAMSSVPRTGGPVCGVAVANKAIRAALSSPSLSQPPRACSLLPRPMLECAHAIRASEGAHNFCVFGHKLLQAAWPGLASKEQGARATPARCLLR